MKPRCGGFTDRRSAASPVEMPKDRIMPKHPYLSVRAVAFAALLLAAIDANAYIDPNAGSLLYQILLPVLLAVAAGWRYLKLVVSNLLRKLTGGNRKEPAPNAPPTNEDSEQ